VAPKDVAWTILLVWGGASAAGVLGRRVWAHKSFGVWAIVAGLFWCVTVFYFGPFVLAALVLARLAVGGAPQPSRAPGAR
jgi:hypothetical protein